MSASMAAATVAAGQRSRGASRRRRALLPGSTQRLNPSWAASARRCSTWLTPRTSPASPTSPGTLVLGEVGLAGEVRGVSQVEQRLAEAAQLGFKRCVLPGSNARRLREAPLDLCPAATVAAAMEALMT